MKKFNISFFFAFILLGFEKVQAQVHKSENKQEIKIKEEPKETIPVVEHQEITPVKEEPKEINANNEHRETAPVKEKEVKTDPQPKTNTSVENNAPKESATSTNTPKASLPKSFAVKRAVMPVKPMIKNLPQK